MTPSPGEILRVQDRERGESVWVTFPRDALLDEKYTNARVGILSFDRLHQTFRLLPVSQGDDSESGDFVDISDKTRFNQALLGSFEVETTVLD